MPSLSRPSRSSPPALRPPVRLLIALAMLTALVALPRARAATTPLSASPASAPAVPAAPSTPSAKSAKPPTCQAIMRRLSGSLAGTPSAADKPGAVLVDVDKAGITMACSHSDAVSIPVPGAGKPR